LKPQEIDGIKKDFEEPGFLAPTGLFLGGEKYMVIQGEQQKQTLRIKKKRLEWVQSQVLGALTNSSQ
jgi:hypothetical protein